MTKVSYSRQQRAKKTTEQSISGFSYHVNATDALTQQFLYNREMGVRRYLAEYEEVLDTALSTFVLQGLLTSLRVQLRPQKRLRETRESRLVGIMHFWGLAPSGAALATLSQALRNPLYELAALVLAVGVGPTALGWFIIGGLVCLLASGLICGKGLGYWIRQSSAILVATALLIGAICFLAMEVDILTDNAVLAFSRFVLWLMFFYLVHLSWNNFVDKGLMPPLGYFLQKLWRKVYPGFPRHKKNDE